MIDIDGRYRECSKSAHYMSYKAPSKILKVTRGVLKEQRWLFHLPFSCLIIKFMKHFLHYQNVQVKVFSHNNFKTMAVPFNIHRSRNPHMWNVTVFSVPRGLLFGLKFTPPLLRGFLYAHGINWWWYCASLRGFT